MKWELSLVALSVLAVAGISRYLTGTSITPAMAFVAIGLLAGPLVADELTLAPASATVRTLAEATLAVVLFSDASRIKLRALRHEYSVPLRLLGIGLPLTIALGALLGAALLHALSFAEVVVLAVMLAPTDAALGQAVVAEPRTPMRIRQGLNVESGLNDGICVPLLLLALGAADVDAHVASGQHVITVVSEEIGYGILGGVATGLLASAIVAISRRRDLITRSWLQVVPVSAAALAYGSATALGGSGFIAAFLAGALFGYLLSRESEQGSLLSEEIGGVLGGVTFLIFGAVMLGPALEHLSWQLALYAGLSLTIVRMLPVAVAMFGSRANWRTVGFLGWFGPRGLASIVFAVIVVQEAHLPATNTILRATYLTVGLSVFAHGISAVPITRRYARWYESRVGSRAAPMESLPVPGHRQRGAVIANSSSDREAQLVHVVNRGARL